MTQPDRQPMSVERRADILSHAESEWSIPVCCIIDELFREVDRLTAELAAERDAPHEALYLVDLLKCDVQAHKTVNQGLTSERDQARAEAAAMREACVECLKAIDDCYTSTGHFRVAKTSEQRLKIEAALQATAASALLNELSGLRTNQGVADKALESILAVPCGIFTDSSTQDHKCDYCQKAHEIAEQALCDMGLRERVKELEGRT